MVEPTPTPAPSATPAPSVKSRTKSTRNKTIESVRIQSYSDVIFFWPTALVSAILIILALIPALNSSGNFVRILSWIWLLVFIYNIGIVAFDFPSGKVFAIVAFIIAVILLLVILELTFHLGLSNWLFVFLMIPVDLNWAFYAVVSVVLGFTFLILYLDSRISYVDIRSNQVYIKKGILGEKINQPTRGMQVFKEIDDVFEYAVLKSGDITLMFPPGSKFVTIALPNVININQKVQDINAVISRTEVDIY